MLANAWRAHGIPLENIKLTLASLKQVTEDRDAIASENKILNRKVYEQDQKIQSILNPDYEVPLPRRPEGQSLGLRSPV